MKLKAKKVSIMGIAVFLLVFTFVLIQSRPQEDLVQTSASSTLSNKKIGWGIKRAENHVQPDLGSKNKQILDQYKGIAMGSPEKKYVYLTFDEGYEAGYTPRILQVLKQEKVNATFFLTAHYVNTQQDLVKQMIEEGHTIGNHTPKSLMSLNYKIIKC